MIFLVDDDLIQNTITSQLIKLCDASAEIEVFNNGSEVIEALKEGKKPTLILLDINMPIMDGWEFWMFTSITKRLQMYLCSPAQITRQTPIG